MSLVRVIPAFNQTQSSYSSSAQLRERWDDARDRLVERATEAQQHIPEEHRGALLFPEGDASTTLVELCEEYDLLIASSGRRQGLARFGEPSVTERVARLSPVPVLVPSVAPFEPHSPSFLLAYDIDDPSPPEVVERAAAWARRFGCRLDLLYVDPALVHSSARQASAEEAMGEVLRGLPEEVPGFALYETAGDSAVVVFGRVANQRVPRAVVLTSHGRKGISHLVMGSFASRLMRNIVHPVLVLPRDVSAEKSG